MYSRKPEPGAAILDSQSIKTTETLGVRGYDAGKKIKERKRHILVDTIGLLLIVVVHTANIQDRYGAKLVLEQVKGTISRLQLIWADAGYSGKLVDWTKVVCGWVLEIVKRSDDVKGFKVLPHRWIVERTFGWLCRYDMLLKSLNFKVSTNRVFLSIQTFCSVIPSSCSHLDTSFCAFLRLCLGLQDHPEWLTAGKAW